VSEGRRSINRTDDHIDNRGVNMLDRLSKARRQRRPLTLERVTPAFVLLAQGVYAREVARSMQVSTTTILNWMDWGWKNQRKTEAYVREHYPELNDEDLAHLWMRMRRRQGKRQRRLDVTNVLTLEARM